MRVFVAGGTGVVGFPSVRALVRAGHDVRATARGAEKADRLRSVGAEPVEADLYDPIDLRRAMRGCDAVVRLTTKLSGPMTAMRRRSFWAETNRLRTAGARALVDAAIAQGARTYISESYYSVYADAGDAVVTESSPVDSAGVETMQAALAGEQEALRFTAAGGTGIVLRFAAFYSPDAPSTQQTVEMVGSRLLPIVGDGRFFFSSIYVDDAAQAVVHALAAPAGAYNVCDDEPVRFYEALDSLAEILGVKPPVRLPSFFGPILIGYPWPVISRSLRLSNAKLKAATKWYPEVTGIRSGWRIVTSALHAASR